MATVGKYQLIEELGRGSMGTVYVARDGVLERHVALKTIRTGLDVDPEIRERFYREARTCAKLTHPSIVTVYDMGDHNGTAFIAMELLKGSDFRKHIDRKTPMPLHEKLDAIIQICDGLAHAHGEGIIHRDVKPSNLFYNSDQRRAKILDFGIARLPSSKLTVMGRILGTPNYMAPEQILNQKSDGRADLFSAAIVFFEFLVHAHPFQAPLIPRRVLDDEPDSLFDYDSSIPRPFEKVFNRAMQKRPEDRYSSADELAADMRALLEGVRADSSPSSSQWVLPSNETQSILVPLQRPIINEELRDSNDPEEWRLAEFLRILPEFEAAADKEDFSKARRLLKQLREIEAVDIRFAASIKVCASRLPKAGAPVVDKKGGAISEPDRKPRATPIEASTAASPEIRLEQANISNRPDPGMLPSPQRMPPRRPDGAVKACEKCRASNRANATFCAACGSKLDRVIAAANEDAPSKGPLKVAHGLYVDHGTTIVKPAESAPPAPPLDAATVLYAGTTATPRFSERRTKFLIGTGSVFCALLVCVAIVLLLHRASWKVHYLATASVIADTVAIYHSPNAAGPGFAALPSGTLLRILKLPASGEDRWLLVEPVIKGQPAEQGYVSREGLGEFDSDDPAQALTLANNLAPQSDPTDEDLVRQIRTFSVIASHFQGTASARTAVIQMSSHEVALARNLAAEGRPEADWRLWTQKAQAAVSEFSSDPEANAVLQTIAAMEDAAAKTQKSH